MSDDYKYLQEYLCAFVDEPARKAWKQEYKDWEKLKARSRAMGLCWGRDARVVTLYLPPRPDPVDILGQLAAESDHGQ